MIELVTKPVARLLSPPPLVPAVDLNGQAVVTAAGLGPLPQGQMMPLDAALVAQAVGTVSIWGQRAAEFWAA